MTGAEQEGSQRRPTPIKRVKIPPYTADGYEPTSEDEWDDVHVEIEVRQFAGHSGKRTSKPKVLKINTNAWPKWYINRGGYSINQVLHRPADVPLIAPDAWDGEEVTPV